MPALTYHLVTRRPLWGVVGMMLAVLGGVWGFEALQPLFVGAPNGLLPGLVVVLSFGATLLGARLGQRHDAVTWVGDELLVQPLGWERYVRSAQQIPRGQIRSYLLEEALRLRLQSGQTIRFGPGDFWGRRTTCPRLPPRRSAGYSPAWDYRPSRGASPRLGSGPPPPFSWGC